MGTALAPVLAHGGTGGLVVELAILVGIVVLAVAAWVYTSDGEEPERENERPG
jgi:hypothetical protein